MPSRPCPPECPPTPGQFAQDCWGQGRPSPVRPASEDEEEARARLREAVQAPGGRSPLSVEAGEELLAHTSLAQLRRSTDCLERVDRESQTGRTSRLIGALLLERRTRSGCSRGVPTGGIDGEGAREQLAVETTETPNCWDAADHLGHAAPSRRARPRGRALLAVGAPPWGDCPFSVPAATAQVWALRETRDLSIVTGSVSPRTARGREQ